MPLRVLSCELNPTKEPVVSNCHSFSENQYDAVRRMNLPIYMAAPTQSIKRSERLLPQAFSLPKNSPAPLRAVHFSDRPAFGPVRSVFFRIAAFAYYVSRSKTVSSYAI